MAIEKYYSELKKDDILLDGSKVIENANKFINNPWVWEYINFIKLICINGNYRYIEYSNYTNKKILCQ